MPNESSPFYQNPETAGLAGSWQSLSVRFRYKTIIAQKIKHRGKDRRGDSFPDEKAETLTLKK